MIALSSRPYVEAAKQAGFRVAAIDAFADRQSLASAERVFIVDHDEHGFNTDMMMSVIDGLDTKDYWGVIYGSGFEAQPALLQSIADRIPLIGNDPASIAAIKTPGIFFAALTKWAIPHPSLRAWCPTGQLNPAVPKKMVRKLTGGSGGTHIQYSKRPQHVSNYYDQEYVEGDSVSLLFLACHGQVQVIGFNEQWLDPSASTPFRYGGAVSNISLSPEIKAQFLLTAHRLTEEFKLKGLNSLDAIVKNGVVYVLEINPRLSATFDLYPAKVVNIVRHIQACQSEVRNENVLTAGHHLHHAHAIVYAPDALAIPTAFDWPAWATDISRDGLIEPQQPVCTVLATAKSSQAARQLAQSRVKMLLESITEINQVKANAPSKN